MRVELSFFNSRMSGMRGARPVHPENGSSIRLSGALAARQQRQGALAGAVHHLLILGYGTEFGGDVGQIPRVLLPHGILQGLQLRVEAEAVVVNLYIEAAALLQRERHRSELIGEMLQHRVGCPDEGAGAVAVGPCVGQSLVADKSEARSIRAAVEVEERMASRIPEQSVAKRPVDFDGPVKRSRIDAVLGVGRGGPRFRREVSGATRVECDRVAGRLKLRMLKGEDDPGRRLRRTADSRLP